MFFFALMIDKYLDLDVNCGFSSMFLKYFVPKPIKVSYGKMSTLEF